MFRKYKDCVLNLIVPTVVFGSVIGALSAAVIAVFKLGAKYAVEFSEEIYSLLRENWYYIPVILVLLVAFSFLLVFIYKKEPNIKGGGIPTSIAVIRGVMSFNWLKSLVGTFFLSLSSFLIGVPLGTEGPCVQMGTSLGRGCVSPFIKKHSKWGDYSMTAGACAGFATATGSPLAGMIFVLEEIHCSISTPLIMVTAVSVMSAYAVSALIAPIFGISTTLFPKMDILNLKAGDFWLPLAVGILFGVFAVLFFNYYRLIGGFCNKILNKIPNYCRILLVFVLTLIFGICGFSFVSTGHELTLSLFDTKTAILMLLAVLLVRTTLTLFANSNGITGGMFIPVLAIGAVLSAVLGKIAIEYFGLSQSYYSVIIVLGITASIAGIMKMPVTAILFSVEALSCIENVIYVVAVSVVSFGVAEFLGAKSTTECVLEAKIKQKEKNKNYAEVQNT